MSTARLAHVQLGRAPGEAPPVVILHGLFGSGTNWRGVGRALGVGFCVYLLDLRNHGASQHMPGMRYAELAADVRVWIENNATGPAVLIGHSMGGKAAMWLALEGGLAIARLCVVDIAPVRYRHPEHGAIVDTLAKLPLDRIERRSDADRALEPTIPDAGLRQFLLQNLVSSDTGSGNRYRWRIDLQAIRDGLDDLLDFEPTNENAFYEGDTHFIRGASSHYLKPPHDEAVRRYFPDASIASVEAAGHWPHAEHPKAFLAALNGWLHAGCQ